MEFIAHLNVPNQQTLNGIVGVNNPSSLFLENENVTVINPHGLLLDNENVGVINPGSLFLENEKLVLLIIMVSLILVFYF